MISPTSIQFPLLSSRNTLSRAAAAPAEPQVLTHTPSEPHGPLPTQDGTHIVFGDGNPLTTRNENIFMVDADGHNLQQLTHRSGINWQPAPSPDGKRIAYVAQSDDDHSDIHVVDADGTHDVNITNTNTGYWEPHWSPDGTQLLVRGCSKTAYGDIFLPHPAEACVTAAGVC